MNHRTKIKFTKIVVIKCTLIFIRSNLQKSEEQKKKVNRSNYIIEKGFKTKEREIGVNNIGETNRIKG